MADLLNLEDDVMATLRRITRAIDLHSRSLLKTRGLTAPQLSALRAIHRGQPMSVGSLARQIHLGQATVTGILGRLESRGLVLRTRGSRDRRSVLVELTAAGRDLVADAPSPLQERFQQRLARLEEWERTMILATLQRIAAMMDVEVLDNEIPPNGALVRALEGAETDGRGPFSSPAGHVDLSVSEVGQS